MISDLAGKEEAGEVTTGVYQESHYMEYGRWEGSLSRLILEDEEFLGAGPAKGKWAGRGLLDCGLPDLGDPRDFANVELRGHKNSCDQ